MPVGDGPGQTIAVTTEETRTRFPGIRTCNFRAIGEGLTTYLGLVVAFILRGRNCWSRRAALVAKASAEDSCTALRAKWAPAARSHNEKPPPCGRGFDDKGQFKCPAVQPSAIGRALPAPGRSSPWGSKFSGRRHCSNPGRGWSADRNRPGARRRHSPAATAVIAATTAIIFLLGCGLRNSRRRRRSRHRHRHHSRRDPIPVRQSRGS